MSSYYIGLFLYICILFWYSIAVNDYLFVLGNTREDVIPKEFHIFKKYKYCYFTCWNFTVQIIFLIIVIFEYLLRIINNRSAHFLNAIRSYIYHVLLLPGTMTVVVVFWSFFSYDRELVLPKALDVIFPPWMNHTMHTIILIPLFIELALPKNSNFITIRTVLKDYSRYFVIYGIMFNVIYLLDSAWLYPLFENISWLQRCIIYLCFYLIGVISGSIGIYLQNRKKSDISFKSD